MAKVKHYYGSKFVVFTEAPQILAPQLPPASRGCETDMVGGVGVLLVALDAD